MSGFGRVLMASKFFHRRGGAEAYAFYLSQSLTDAGYEVIPFAMAHPENDDSRYAEYFVSQVDMVEGLRSRSFAQRAKVAVRVIYSGEAARRIAQLCRAAHPDIAHLHNIYHHLSPSILGALKGQGVPIVMSLHDYKLICPTYLLLAPDGVCERCRGGRFHQAVIHRCSKGSLSASLLVAAEAYVHRFLGSYDQVDAFICPSRFLLEKMVAHGLPRAKMVHIPYFAPVDEFKVIAGAAKGEYVVYFGRLSAEKGLTTLLAAMTRVRHIPLVIVGEGADGDRLRAQARELGLSNVSFLARVAKPALADLVGRSRYAVLPSECYENFPVSVLEAFSMGRTVIGSRIGGIPELVRDGETGLLFQPGDPDDLAAKLDYLFQRPAMAEELGLQARGFAETHFEPRQLTDQITQLYSRVRTNAGAAPRQPAAAGDFSERGSN